MKKKFIAISAALVLCISFCFGQKKIEKYCEVTVIGKRIYVDQGSAMAIAKDSDLNKDSLNIKRFKSVVDVLEFMNRSGWTLVSSMFIPENQKVFYFKKNN